MIIIIIMDWLLNLNTNATAANPEEQEQALGKIFWLATSNHRQEKGIQKSKAEFCLPPQTVLPDIWKSKKASTFKQNKAERARGQTPSPFYRTRAAIAIPPHLTQRNGTHLVKTLFVFWTQIESVYF